VAASEKLTFNAYAAGVAVTTAERRDSAPPGATADTA
jgi:hypothetical protein